MRFQYAGFILLFLTTGIYAHVSLPNLGGFQSQRLTGELQIVVKDPAGSPIEITGKLTGISNGVIRNIQTDKQGKADLTGLPFGRFRLELAKEGFATQSLLIDVQSNVPILQSVTMALGSVAFNVDVVATTPLAGVEQSRAEIAAPVQAKTQQELNASGALDLADFTNRRLNGVHVNEVQGNPYQPDLNYRGYTASPLLGTPQGLSVYLDGVRLNQPFGDVVSWDLIPTTAISELTLMPGSNPIFGLNTLGGALTVQTKDGNRAPGTALQLSSGSFGRKAVEFEHGGANLKGLHWYLASNLSFEEGWREESPSNVRQFFGKLGWQRTKTLLGLTIAYANNSLAGNGLQELRFLKRDYASVYTKPDITNNRSPFLNFTARHSATNSLVFSGNAYYRYIRSSTFNGDINESALDQSVYQPSAAERAALAAAGYTGFPTSGANAANTPFPYWRCIGQALLNDEPAEKCNGLLNRTGSEQYNYGAAGQVSWFGFPRGHRNQFTAGGGYDRSKIDFRQSTQLGYLNPDRSITGVKAFGDGVTGGTVDGEPFDTRVDLHGVIYTASLFATDTFSLGQVWGFTLAGRYNRTTVNNRDRITPGGGAGSLDGQHVFGRFNPSVGVTFRPLRILNAYFSYNEGSRAPTSVELGCADPNQPCKLPNAMAGDPPLNQVVTRTVEAGFRGERENILSWSVGWFRAENRNDILFVASNQTGLGYFKNFGRTRRQGLDVDLSGRMGRISLGGGYTFLDATYQSPEFVNGSGNSTSDASSKGLDGLIQIQPGARIPLIPQHLLKAYADVQVTKKVSVNIGLLAMSQSYARGNENNLHQADGTYFLDAGTSPGYAVTNLNAHYQIHRRVELFAKINNLFNRQYYTAAQLGPTGFTDAGNFIARPFAGVNGEFPVVHTTFYAPGAPRGIWGGIRFKL